MTSATMVSPTNTHREYGPTFSPNAAPEFRTRLSRSQSPLIGRDAVECRICNATFLVMKSAAAIDSRTGQNSAALLLCIFLSLLAIDAVSGVGERIETLERDFVAT